MTTKAITIGFDLSIANVKVCADGFPEGGTEAVLVSVSDRDGGVHEFLLDGSIAGMIEYLQSVVANPPAVVTLSAEAKK